MPLGPVMLNSSGRGCGIGGSTSDSSASETRTGCRRCTTVSNEVSNYCGANRQPRLYHPVPAPGVMGIDAHLACFTRKRSLFQGDHETVAI